MNHLHQKKRTKNPKQETNWFLNLFFVYTRKILTLGFKTGLSGDDIYEVVPSHESKKLGDLLEKNWNKQKLKNKRSVFRLLWTCFGKEYLLILGTTVISIAITYLQPKLVKKYILFYTANSQITKNQAALYGASLVTVIFIRWLYFDNYDVIIGIFALKLRASFTSLIYRKILRTKISQVGKVITLITRDVNEFEDAVKFITQMITDLLKLLITCYVLYTEIGWLFNILIGIVGVIFIIDVSLAYLVAKLKLRSLKKTGERYQLMKEILAGLQIIRVGLWNNIFEKKMNKLRKKESHLVQMINFLLFAKLGISRTIIKGAWYVLVVSLILSGSELNAGLLLLIMNAIETISLSVGTMIPTGFHETVTMIAILKRIEKFLQQEDPYVKYNIRNRNSQTCGISLQISNTELYDNLNLNINEGITAITGPIASGKTLLLKIIMQEVPINECHLDVAGTISYASQEPWLFPSTIKQNIIFGSPFDEKKYFEVLRVCALLEDLDYLQDGDDTIVSDRGSNLSGGQQARINLARAVYRDSDIYLLDDCLSSLDENVADFIFMECFRTYLKNKIIILVTQNEKHIRWSDRAIIFQYGRFASLPTSPEAYQKKNEIKNDIQNIEFKQNEEICEPNTKLLQPERQKRIYVESKHFGGIFLKIYKKYINYAGGFYIFTVLCVCLILGQIGKSVVYKLESHWINVEQSITEYKIQNKTFDQDYEDAYNKRLQMYYLIPILIIGQLLLALVKGLLCYLLGKSASVNIHENMLTRVMNASMEFFDNNFLGNILNRFSEDLLFVDEKITVNIFFFLDYLLTMIGIIVVIVTVKTTFLVPCLALSTVVALSGIFYIRSGRDLKRLEISVRCPLIGHINATIEGLSTIKTFGVETTICNEFDRYQDTYTSASYIYVCCYKAFNFFAHLCSVIFTAFVVVIYLFFYNNASAGDVGLALSQALMFSGTQMILFHTWAQVECDMTAFQRILDYTQLKQEHKDGFLVEKFPTHGKIKYDNVYFAYKSNKNYGLRNLNFVVNPMEKVAIIGRTAAGKTTLVSLLLRLYKPEGKIYIDDVDITTLPLDFFRSKVSYVAQEPFLFCGTIRENIDPRTEFNDEEIWKTLEKVHLNNLFSTLEDGISNLSVGQKQLVCLGRAILRNSKIIILDEVTANVDSDTEKIINEIIENNFADSTVLMITHKTDYALQCDKVIVLDKGNLVEYGKPSDLLMKRRTD